MSRTWAIAAGAFALGVGIILTGCDEEKKAPEPAAQPPASTSTATSGPSSDQRSEIKKGDAVIVESGTAVYWAGKVVEVDGDKVKYEYGTNRSQGESERDRVYVVASDHRTVAREDDVAVCKTGPTNWNPCEIKRVDRGSYIADDLWGKMHTLEASEIVVPNEAGRERLREKLEEANQHRAFVQAARAAGWPRRPEGWTPRPGDDVVAKFTDASWYGGRIRRLTPTKIHIAWDDKSEPSQRDHDEVVPKPEAAQEVEAGQYVLGRPRRGTLWDYFRVESVDEKGVVIVDKDGRKRKVRQSDVIPLGG